MTNKLAKPLMKWIKNMRNKLTETQIVTAIKRRYTTVPAVIKQIVQDHLEKLHTKNCENVDEKGNKKSARKEQLIEIDTRRNRKLEYCHNYFEKLSL